MVKETQNPIFAKSEGQSLEFEPYLKPVVINLKIKAVIIRVQEPLANILPSARSCQVP